MDINGISLAVDEHGPADGPLVVLLHGFPELGRSWRHQVGPLAAAGHRVLVPDLRGYGASDAPAAVEAYAIDVLARDVLGMLDHAGVEQAVLVGHDWGADLAWKTAWLHPERVRAVAGLSVPFLPRAPAPPVGLLREHLGEGFYLVWFQEPGVAEAALERDVRRTLATTKQWTAAWAAQQDDHPPTPSFMTDEDLAGYVEVFERTGFRGGLNWYRNLDRNWERTVHIADRRIEMPALFLTGERDPVRKFMPAAVMEGWVADLRQHVIPGAGHWLQQQAPQEVTDHLLAWLREVAPA